MKRIRSFDVLRVLSFFAVIWYHMVFNLVETGIYAESRLVHWYTIANTHIALPAVAVFFMLSGAVLSLRSDRAFSLPGFLKKRFSRLLIPYYLLTVTYFAMLLIIHRGKTDFFPPDIPLWRAVFNFFGMDGWMKSHGVPSFYFGIGEWFLGALVILSLLFPLFRLALRKAPVLFLAAATGVYVFFAVHGTPGVAEFIILPMEGYEFILGMYIGAYYDRIPKKAWMIALPLTVALLLIPSEWLFSQSFRTTLQAAGLMISFSGLEPLLAKHKLRALDTVSGYSYEMFLTHHIVIAFIAGKLQSRLGDPKWIALTFAAEIVCTVVLAVILKWITRITSQALKL